MKTQLSIKRFVFLYYNVCGILFLADAVISVAGCMIASVNSNVARHVLWVCAFIVFLAIVCIQGYTDFAHREKKDEMAEADMKSAFYQTSKIIDLIVLLAGLVLMIYVIQSKNSRVFEIPAVSLVAYIIAVIFGVYGLKRLLTGIIFHRLEKED